MTVFCYPQPKEKARVLCRAFAEGCGGTVISDGRLRDGPAMFYGVVPGMEHLWRGVQDGRDWFYSDNAYFDVARTGERIGTASFRITKNKVQHSGLGASDGSRFGALGARLEPWREGRHVVVCPQSDAFMRTIVGYEGDWLSEIVTRLRAQTARPIVVRQWSRNKAAQMATLTRDLVDAAVLVTFNSAAAVNAALAGVPVICDPSCAAWPMSSLRVDALRYPAREQWAGVLADNQWTIDEIANGTAWRMLND